MRLQIVVPMAGRGQRFVAAGFTQPKPLIPVLGEPMFAWSMRGLPLSLADRLIVLALREHLAEYPLERDIAARYAQLAPRVIAVDAVTEGQACTVRLAAPYLDPAEPLLIHNGDTYFQSGLARLLHERGAEVDGAITVFESSGPQYSYAALDDSGFVREVAEKRVISPWATTGTYYFGRAVDFMKASEAMIAAGERYNGEFYVGPVYNHMIREGARIIPDRATEIWPLGTPAELDRFLSARRATP